ncbi:MAG: hypothetical protein ACJA06_000536 [Halocynthiibacter sp.]|jgi:hypothetical protein
MKKDIAALETLAQLILDSELARLQGISKEQEEKASAIKALQDARKTRDEILLDGPDMAQFAGADVRWHRWMAGAQRSLAIEAAQIAARREAQLAVSRKAFGRVQVLGKLTGKK